MDRVRRHKAWCPASKIDAVRRQVTAAKARGTLDLIDYSLSISGSKWLLIGKADEVAVAAFRQAKWDVCIESLLHL
jgi:hypothetical protein